MTDADLRALFEAWLRDRAQVHKLAHLQTAQLRAYTEAVTQAAVRTTYPPQIRAQSPAEAPPAADEGSAGPGGPAEGRGGSTATPKPTCGSCGAPRFMYGCKDDGVKGNCAVTHMRWDRSALAAQAAPAITHADGSPLLRPQDDFGRRHAARLVPRTVLLDGRGDAAPRNPEDGA